MAAEGAEKGETFTEGCEGDKEGLLTTDETDGRGLAAEAGLLDCWIGGLMDWAVLVSWVCFPSPFVSCGETVETVGAFVWFGSPK